MIFKSFTSKRPPKVDCRYKPPVAYPTASVGTPHAAAAIDMDRVREAKRRDNIIRKLTRECPYLEGEEVTPIDAADKITYGETVTVLKILTTYAHFGRNEEWPTNDNPMIITARSEKTGTFNCTVNFLEPLNKGC